MMDRSEFFVDLISNASMDLYPENTLSCFTNKLAVPLELDGEYEVALTEIVYPLEIDGSRSVDYHFMFIPEVVMPNGRKRVYSDYSKKYSMRYDPREGYERIFARLTEHMISSLEENYPDLDMENDPWIYQTGEYFNLKAGKTKPMKLENEGFVEQVKKKSQTNVLTRVVTRAENIQRIRKKVSRDQPKFEEQRIFDGKKWSTKSGGGSQYFVMPKFVSGPFYELIGLDSRTYGIKLEQIEDENETMIWIGNGYRDSTNFIFVYSDIVEGHHIGDVMSNSLRVLPLSRGSYEDLAYETFGNQYFFPVRYPRIETITIKLADEVGDKIRFKGGRVYLTLKFRRKLI